MQKFGQDDELHQSLQELFPSSSTDEKLEDMMVLTKAYHKYKRKYVKHLSFNSTEKNLSKVISCDQSLSTIGFSYDARACPVAGSVYLL